MSILPPGKLLGIVSDQQGQGLIGVTLTLTRVGQKVPQVQITNNVGEYRFLDLEPGSYTLEVQSEGFQTFYDSDILIPKGRNTNLEITLVAASPAANG